MATASVTYTFVDGTTGDADEVNQNFTDIVNFLNASVVHADGGVPMTGTLDLGNNGFKNLGSYVAAHRDFDTALWSATTTGSWLNYPNLSVTITDPGVPITVLAWVNVSHKRAAGGNAGDTYLTVEIDGDIQGHTRSYSEAENHWRNIAHFSRKSFDPSGNFVVRPQVQFEADSQDFRYSSVVALVLPQ